MCLGFNVWLFWGKNSFPAADGKVPAAKDDGVRGRAFVDIQGVDQVLWCRNKWLAGTVVDNPWWIIGRLLVTVVDAFSAPSGCGMNSTRALILPSDKQRLLSPLAQKCTAFLRLPKQKMATEETPRIQTPPGNSQDWWSISHRRNRIVDIIPFSDP